MDITGMIFNIALTILISYSLLRVSLLGDSRKHILRIIKSLRLSMFLLNLPVLALTIAVGILLNSVVGLSWGWTSLLSNDGSTQNINMVGFNIPWIAPFFAILLLLALPRLAEIEEEVFRKGTTGVASAIVRSLIFGLVHMIAGISLGYALALTIAGLWFSYQYKRGGVERATAYHLAWNYTIVLIVLASLLVEFITS